MTALSEPLVPIKEIQDQPIWDNKYLTLLKLWASFQLPHFFIKREPVLFGSDKNKKALTLN
jgi:hypothetical protein